MTRICARLRDERGWGLVSSVLVVGILLSLSLPLMSLVDGQQLQSSHERKSESSFNLAEGALDASVFVLGKNWPAVAGGAYPATCTNVSSTTGCPTPAVLASAYTGGDYTDPGWSIQIRDDDGTEYYDPATVPSRPTWDANGNQRIWVRADAHAAKGERSVVALVRRIDRTIAFPRNAITSGWLEITPSAPKVYVDTQGNAAQPAGVAVRCTNPPPSPKCLDFRQGQVSPDTVTMGFAGNTAVMAETLDQLRERAQALGTYSSGCPSSPAGALVFVESGNCSYAGGGSANSSAVPGMFVVATGRITFSGSFDYYGMVYGANLQASTDAVVSIQGTATVFGSIAVDGAGGVRAGSSGPNVVYNDGIFPNITTFSGAAPVQGTWRELPAS